MIIKISKKRKEFEKLLRKLGYRDRSPIIKGKYKKKIVLKGIKFPQDVEVWGFVKYFMNKKSYLWYKYCQLIEELNKDVSEIEKKNIKFYIKEIMKGILYDNDKKSVVSEMGWEIQYWYRFSKVNKNDLYKIYLNSIKNFKRLLKSGEFGAKSIKPFPGVILVSHPSGMRLFKNDFLEKKASQREKINMRFFNFSKVNSCGDQYAVYDENLDLHPTI